MKKLILSIITIMLVIITLNSCNSKEEISTNEIKQEFLSKLSLDEDVNTDNFYLLAPYSGGYLFIDDSATTTENKSITIDDLEINYPDGTEFYYYRNSMIYVGLYAAFYYGGLSYTDLYNVSYRLIKSSLTNTPLHNDYDLSICQEVDIYSIKKSFMKQYDDSKGYPSYDISDENLVVIASYNGGYLLACYLGNIHGNPYIFDEIDGISLVYYNQTYFYFYKDNTITYGIDEIYANKLMTKDDILDLSCRFNATPEKDNRAILFDYQG